MKRIIFVVAIALLALVSCNKTESEPIPSNSDTPQVTIKFSSENPDTRAFFDATAAAEAWEKSINKVSVFVFTATDGKLVVRRDMTAAELTGGTVKFSLPWSATDKSLNFHAIANYDVTVASITETALKALIEVDSDSYNGTFNTVSTSAKRAEGFTMSGYKEVISQSANASTTVEMVLRRTVAKVAMKVTVDDEFAQRYGGAGIKITNVSVVNTERSTPVVAPAMPSGGILDMVLNQTPNVNSKSYESLFYLFENGLRQPENCVTLKIEALFDMDGNFSTTHDQSVTEYEIRLNHTGNGALKRNGYYRIDATLKGLDGHEVEVTIKVSDWETPVTQSEELGS